jgi:hypothetical protein
MEDTAPIIGAASCPGAANMTVMVAEDRSMCVQPHQVVRTAWVDIDLCKLGFRLPMSPEAVEKKFRKLLNIGNCAPWPPIVGHWEGERFLVDDGRHDYLAALMMGRDKLFVCWLEASSVTVAEPRQDEIGRLLPGSDSAEAPVSSYFAEPTARRTLWARTWRKCRPAAAANRDDSALVSADPPLPPEPVRS